MGEKSKPQDVDPNYETLAESLIYLGDQVRSGLDNLADAVRSRPIAENFSMPVNNQMPNHHNQSQEENDKYEWKTGKDEIPDMRDDDPLPDFGRKPGK